MSKKLCKTKKNQKGKNPAFECKKCDALAKKKKHLCKPQKL